MKCPRRYITTQMNYKRDIMNENKDDYVGSFHIFSENQSFCECYKEQCAAWDYTTNSCKLIDNA